MTGVGQARVFLGSLMLAAALAASSPAATLMDRASDGYVYFHRTGADMATHDAAVATCVRMVKGTQEPYLMPVGGVVGRLVQSAQQAGMDRVAFAANLENCMVARGWDVVRLDDAEGAGIAGLPQPEQAVRLAVWVGAKDPHGQIVRQFAPIDTLSWSGRFDDHPGPPSLSLTSGVYDLSQLQTPYNPPPADWRALQNGDAQAAYAADASVIVIRVKTTAPAQRAWTFIWMEAPAADGSDPRALTYFLVASPTKLFWKAGTVLEKTYVIRVPPGH